MRFKHDCEKCTYLGQSGKYDLYVCSSRSNIIDTVIARFGDNPGDYTSGLLFAIRFKEGFFPGSENCEALAKAMNQALTLGYLMPLESML